MAALLAVVTLATLTKGCDASEEALSDEKPMPNISTIDYGVYRGAVVVRTVEGKSVVVSLDEEDATGKMDGKVDRVFTLQSNVPLSENVTKDYGRARLSYVRGNLYLSDERSREGLHLAVGERRLSPAEAESAPLTEPERVVLTSVNDKKMYRVYEGYGLNQHEGGDRPAALVFTRTREAYSFERSLTDCPVSRSVSALAKSVRAGAQLNPCNCTSGGVGATQCATSGSGGSCSTTCGEGYYACCGPNGNNGAATCPCLRTDEVCQGA